MNGMKMMAGGVLLTMAMLPGSNEPRNRGKFFLILIYIYHIHYYHIHIL